MKFISSTITGKVLLLAPIGDIHLGSAACAKSHLASDISALVSASKIPGVSVKVILMGDIVDAVGSKDIKRYDPRDIDPDLHGETHRLIQAQLEMAHKYLRPIAPLTIAALEGNHEASITKYHGIMDAHIDGICNPLGVPDASYMAHFTLKFRGFEKKVIAHHGYGGGRLIGSKVVKVHNLFNICTDADIAMCGHTHVRAISDMVQLHTENGRFVADEKLAVNTGSYLRTFSTETSGYSERACFDPPAIGAPAILIDARSGLTTGVNSLQAAVAILKRLK